MNERNAMDGFEENEEWLHLEVAEHVF